MNAEVKANDANPIAGWKAIESGIADRGCCLAAVLMRRIRESISIETSGSTPWFSLRLRFSTKPQTAMHGYASRILA